MVRWKSCQWGCASSSRSRPPTAILPGLATPSRTTSAQAASAFITTCSMKVSFGSESPSARTIVNSISCKHAFSTEVYDCGMGCIDPFYHRSPPRIGIAKRSNTTQPSESHISGLDQWARVNVYGEPDTCPAAAASLNSPCDERQKKKNRNNNAH